MQSIPWYQSAILRQQVVQILLAGFGLFHVAVGIDLDAWVAAVFTAAGGGVAIWTIITRLVKPAPNLTAKAEAKEQQLVAAGKLKGFARPSMLLILAIIGLVGVMLSGCTGTGAAYKAAEAAREQSGSLEATAYVVTRHYRNLLREAADLKEAGSLAPSIVLQLQAAERATTPLFIGDVEHGVPSLRDLAKTYDDALAAFNAARTAETAKAIADANRELQAALSKATIQLAGFLRALEAARGNSTSSSRPAGPLVLVASEVRA